MNNLNTKLLKGLLTSKVSIKEIEKFKEDFNCLDDKSFIGRTWLLDTKQIPPFTKNRKNIISFVEKYKDFIILLEENNILGECTTGFDINYYWEDIYKKALLDIKDSTKAIDLINNLESKGYKTISFVSNKELSKNFYEKVNKKYDKEEYELEYYFSNGTKYYLAQYSYDYYPIYFKDANIIFLYKTGNFYSNKNEVYLSTFDIDINSIKFPESIDEIVNSIDKNERKKFNLMCENLRNLEKIEERLNYKINTLKKLVAIKELKMIHQKELEKANKQLKENNELKKKIIEEYDKLGYDKQYIEKSLKYLKEAEWYESIDID